MTDPPPGFTRRVVRAAETVLRSDVEAQLLAAGVDDPESLRARASAEYAGRGRPFGVEVAGAGRVFVRPYLHGGALRSLTGDLHVGAGRFADELRAHVAAAAAGVPVCEALGYVARAAGLGLRRGWLLLREIPGARDLLEVLRSGPPPARRRALLVAAGRGMRALHDAGFDHPDLHLKNLLVDADDTVRVLDLDRVRRRPSLARERRIAGLFRFDRHAEKVLGAGSRASRSDRMRILRAYAGPDWPGRADLRDLAARLRRHIGRHGHMRRAAAAHEVHP